MNAPTPEQPSSGQAGDAVPGHDAEHAELGVGAGRGLETEVSGDVERGAQVSPDAISEHAALPARIGPYRIEALLGRGGMGEVYRGWDPRLQRSVAIKRILGERARPSARARFWREARVLAALKHPGLVALHDIGEDDDTLFIAMELVEGAPLSTSQGVRWPLDAAVALVMHVGRALGTAHAAGIVHRDVKPSNVLVEPSGAPRLIDFGLARRGDDEELTREGTIVGTWSAMAPEQIAGEQLMPQTDVHALGVMLFALLTGVGPYARDSREATAAAILSSAAPDLTTLRPDVPDDLAALVKKTLARRATYRPKDAAALADALAIVASTHGWRDDHAVIAEGIAIVRAIGTGDEPPPVVGSGIMSASPSLSRPRISRAHARRATWAVIAGALVTVSIGLTNSGSDTNDDARLQAAATRPMLASLGVDALRTLPRKIVAVIPQLGDTDLTDATLATAEGIRRTLAFAPETMALVSWRELAARSPDGDPLHLQPADLFRGAGARDGVDVVIATKVVRGDTGLHLVASMHLPGHAEPVNEWTVDVPESSPILGARTLATTLAAELHAPISESLLPTRGDVTQAVALTVRAGLAEHFDRQREAHRLFEAARGYDPSAMSLRLLAAQEAIALGDRDAVVRELRSLRDATEPVEPRDRSYADTLLADYDGRKLERRRKLEAHVARFPRDIDAHIDLLQLDFYALGAGKLELAGRRANAVLDLAPATPLVASKLVRAFAWIGDSARARASLAAHGLDASSPGMASVFGELAMYERDYPTAIATFARAREEDGDLAFYAANMDIAARMLDGQFDVATALARALIPKADPPSADWTYILMYNALVGGSEVVLAEKALDDWTATTGTQAGANYWRYRWYLDAFTSLDRDALLEALVARDPDANDGVVSYLVARYARDPELVAERSAAAQASVNVQHSTVVATLRMIEALEARRAYLAGDGDGALATMAALAHCDDWQVTHEGELFEHARWMSAYAALLDETGRTTEAEAAWRETLALGYERVLAMDVTYEAMARLR